MATSGACLASTAAMSVTPTKAVETLQEKGWNSRKMTSGLEGDVRWMDIQKKINSCHYCDICSQSISQLAIMSNGIERETFSDDQCSDRCAHR